MFRFDARSLFILLFAALAAPARSAAANEQEAERRELPPLELHIDRDQVDLEARRLVVRLSRPAGRVELKVQGESGVYLAETAHDFAGKPANVPLVVSWSPSSDEPVARIEVYAFDKYDYYKAVAIVPWSFSVPHEEVVFERDSALIREAEVPKLQASLELIVAGIREHEKLGPITLYIAGHTDTRGSAQYNRALSVRRARSIANWFRQNGVGIPIAYAGFGESMLLVETPDEVDEPRNRRVDYLLSVEPPRLKRSGVVPGWKRL